MPQPILDLVKPSRFPGPGMPPEQTVSKVTLLGLGARSRLLGALALSAVLWTVVGLTLGWLP